MRLGDFAALWRSHHFVALNAQMVVPKEFSLAQNFPNPFNPTTTFSCSLKDDAHVSLKVYDMLGREVASVVNEMQRAGSYSIPYDASHLASGVYLYKLTAEGFSAVRRFVFLK